MLRYDKNSSRLMLILFQIFSSFFVLTQAYSFENTITLERQAWIFDWINSADERYFDEAREEYLRFEEKGDGPSTAAIGKGELQSIERKFHRDRATRGYTRAMNKKLTHRFKILENEWRAGFGKSESPSSEGSEEDVGQSFSEESLLRLRTSLNPRRLRIRLESNLGDLSSEYFLGEGASLTYSHDLTSFQTFMRYQYQDQRKRHEASVERPIAGALSARLAHIRHFNGVDPDRDQVFELRYFHSF